MGEDHDYDITGEEKEQDEMDVDEDDYGYSYVYADEDEDDTNALSQKSYTILKEEDIHQHQEEDITTISTVLSISREAACLLLRRYNWSVNNVHEAWFAHEERVRRAVGILKKPLVKSPSFKEAACSICLETYSCDSFISAGCSHFFCNACWKAYISTSISDGPGCLALRCPDPSCGAAVGQDMINKLASNEDKEKYHHFLLRSYVEDNHKIKGCPRCDFAVEYVVCNGSYDVTCSCSYTFCWNCTKEAHQPVDCETVAKWGTKEEEKESAILQRIRANSKPCPRCKRLIEKDQGCMHMTCACEFEFCWLCLGAWSDHVERTGGLNACNPYEAVRQEGVYDEAERRREMAKNSSERYTHYYERWASNESSRRKALVHLRQMQSVHLGKLSEVQSQPESQLKFILEAWQQIVECRRVLKWTYAYGYYLPENEHTKKQFLYNLQGDAEAGLERLHQCAEKELMNYLNSDGPSKDFNDFRMKLADRTRVTRNYFENLVRALENGLSDVDSQADDSGNWACDLCTYVNARSATTCQMCQLPLTYAPRHETEIFRPAFHD